MSTELLVAIAAALSIAALAGGYVPLTRGAAFAEHPLAITGEAFAAGVFFGAGLIHMLSDAAEGAIAAGSHAVVTDTICGAVVVVLVATEHWARKFAAANAPTHPSIALIAAAMLSIHTFLAGAALGGRTEAAIVLVIFAAIFIHKVAAAFALGLTLSKSSLSSMLRWLVFLVFVAFLPFGIASGHAAERFNETYPLIDPVIAALAAGTFIYLGLLHGFDHGVVAKGCRSPSIFLTFASGFALMAVIAIWV